MGEKKYAFRDPNRLAGFAKAVFWAMACTEVLLCAAMIWQYRLLGMLSAGKFETREQMMAFANASDATITGIQWFLDILVVPSVVLFLMWVYRVNANVIALGADNLDITPGFAAGVYFIPFANLFYPPQNMAQVWRASIDAARWQEQKGTFLVALWWTLWVLGGIGGIGSLIAKPSAPATVAALQGFSVYMAGFFAISAAARVTFISLIRRITAAQTAQHGRLQTVA